MTRGVPLPNNSIRVEHQIAMMAPHQIIINPAVSTPGIPKPALDLILEMLIKNFGMIYKTLKGPMNPYKAPSTIRKMLL